MSLVPLPQLLSLAPELVEHIIKQISEKDDLLNLRLVCKTLERFAAKELFKEVFVTPSEEHMKAWNNISENDTIRQLPRHAIIQTRPDIDNDYFFRHDGLKVGSEFHAVIAALVKFPNLDSLEIAFTPQCVGRESVQDAMEEPDDRENTLRIIFQAVADRAATETNRTIHKLTIENLQNCPIPDFTSSDLFLDTMKQINELHVSITREDNQEAPDNDYEAIELRTFPPHFAASWLRPVSAHLRSLSIYHRDNWGPLPGYWSFSELSFPKLEALALGYYTLAHDDDVAWILAMPSLRKLILQDCMIVSWIRLHPERSAEWGGVQTGDWVDFPYEAVEWEEDLDIEYWSFRYNGTWGQVFEKLSEMPLLVDFRFDYVEGADGRYGVGESERESCGRRVSEKRYVCYDDGTIPWWKAFSDGEMESWVKGGFPRNVHKEELEADQASLDRLIDGLGLKGEE